MTGEQLTESQYKIALQPVQRRRNPDPGPKQLEQYVSRLSFDRAATWGLTEISTSPVLVIEQHLYIYKYLCLAMTFTRYSPGFK